MKKSSLQSTFKDEDVSILLNDVSDKVDIINVNDSCQKSKIKNLHYCDYIPSEDIPSDEYIDICDEMLNMTAKQTSELIAILATKIVESYNNVVLISLARGGIVPAILIKRYCKKFYGKNFEHYAVGMSRGKGIDFEALNYIINKHKNNEFIFIDGWLAKGTTKLDLDKSLVLFNKKYKQNIKPILATISDLKQISDITATYEDVLLPFSLFNSIACGLISRITQNTNIIDEKSFNGAVFFKHLKNYDKTNEIINKIEQYFDKINLNEIPAFPKVIFDESYIIKKYNISNINGLKAGLNETIRILLKRDVSFVIVKNSNSIFLKPIIYLCNNKNIEIKIDEKLGCEAVAVIEKHIGNE